MDKTLGDVWDWEQTEGEEGEEGGREKRAGWAYR